MKIGIVLLATNAYFVLGVRFIRKFIKHYKGNKHIKFYFYSDTDPHDYLSDDCDVKYIPTYHNEWVKATNDKFNSIIGIDSECDYIYYFDADTNINTDFKEDWFIGDLVGGEHFGNRTWLANGNGYDKNPDSSAYVDVNSQLSKIYYYGAFFGGKRESVIDFCKTLIEWQTEDKKINYEPPMNDESYINKYFHYNPPLIIKCEDFKFIVSDKGGIGSTRDVSLDITQLKVGMLKSKNIHYDIAGGFLIKKI